MGFGSGEGFTPGRNHLVGDFTVEGQISASNGVTASFYYGDGSFLQNVTGSGGGGGGNVTVGDSIDSGTGNRVLYENSSNKIAESANLTFNGTTLAAGATTVSTLSASSGLTGSSFWVGDTGTGITNTGVVSAHSSLTSSNGITGSSLQISDGSRHYGITNEGNVGVSTLSASSNITGSTLKLEHGLTASSILIDGHSVATDTGYQVTALYVSGGVTGSGGLTLMSNNRSALQISSALDVNSAIQFWKGSRNQFGKWVNFYARGWEEPSVRVGNADGRVELKIPHRDLPGPSVGSDNTVGDRGFLFHNAQTSSYASFHVACTTSVDYIDFGFTDRESSTPAIRILGNGKITVDCGNVDTAGTYAGTSSPAAADNQFLLQSSQINFGTASNCIVNVTGGIRVTPGAGSHDPIAGYVSASSGLTGSSFQISDGSRHYGMTNEGKLGISSFAANWTNAGNTIADLGTVTTADINGGSIDGATIGANSAAAGTFGQVLVDGFFVDQVAPDDLGDNADTITAANMLKRISILTLSANRTKATDTAANIVAAITNPVADMAFDWSIINSGEGPDMDLTLSAGTGVTLALGFSDLVCRADEAVTLRVRLTNVGGGSEAVTIYRIA